MTEKNVTSRNADFVHYAYLAGHDAHNGKEIYVIDIVGDDGKTLSGVWHGDTEAEMREATKLGIFEGCTIHFCEPPEWMVPR